MTATGPRKVIQVRRGRKRLDAIERLFLVADDEDDGEAGDTEQVEDDGGADGTEQAAA